MSMTAAVNHQLGILAQHAIWTRDAAWLSNWYNTIFVPVCTGGSITAPLAALDICSALDRGAQREGKWAGRRKGYAAWRQFLGALNHAGQIQGRTTATASASKHAALVRRTIRAFSLSVMSREWTIRPNSWTFSGQNLAERLLEAEAARLNGTENTGILEELWAVLDSSSGEDLHACLPPAVWSNLHDRQVKLMDPFLFPLLDLTPESEELIPPAIWGSSPQAIHSRRRLGAAGEFAKRDLGPLPSNLARLAPSELMFFAEAANHDQAKSTDSAPGQRSRSANGRYAPESTPIPSAALRSLFVMKTSEGRLLQRFSYEPDPSTMEPTGMLHIEIADSAEYHALTANAGAPAITWFRAVTVHLIHHFARFATKSRWSVAVALTYSFSRRYSTGLIPPSYRESLAESGSNALNLLIAANARAFQSGWPGLSEHLPPETRQPPEMDYCLRIILGAPDESAELPNGLLVRARQQWGARIEKAPNGRWGLAVTGETTAAPSLPVFDLDQIEGDPSIAAVIILRSILKGTFVQSGGAL